MPSSAYQQRIANYLAAHPGATRQEARGHGATPEHGALGHAGPAGHVTELTRTGDIARELERINTRQPGSRVEITTFDRQGNAHAVMRETRAGRERGVSASGLAATLRRHRTFKAGITNFTGLPPYKKDRRFTNITRVQIRVIPSS